MKLKGPRSRGSHPCGLPLVKSGLYVSCAYPAAVLLGASGLSSAPLALLHDRAHLTLLQAPGFRGNPGCLSATFPSHTIRFLSISGGLQESEMRPSRQRGTGDCPVQPPKVAAARRAVARCAAMPLGLDSWRTKKQAHAVETG